MDVSVSGSGNAVTAISKSGTTIIVTKGTTFLTSHQSLASYLTKTDAASLYQPKGNYLTAHQSLDGYVNAIAVSGSGNAVTAVTKSGKTITFTKGATYLTSHQSLSNYYTKSSVDSLLNGKSATTHTHSVKINGITKTIAASGGDAVDLGTYLTTHQSLAAYATQNWVKNEATAHNADMVDNYHASGLFTGFSISDVANKVTISIGGTSKALNLVRAFPSGVGNNFNDIATHGNSMGMSNIAAPYASSTANYQTLNGYVNPNGQTGWHHYINLSYTDSDNTATSPNMWQTQFAIKAGTTEVYVRSRAGGKISNDAAWAAPWVRLARVTDNVASASKVTNALSWSGYSSGSYNGSAVKSISIPNNTNQLTNGAGFITASASITGNAGSATKLQTTRTLWGQSFNGTANISGSMTGVGDMTLDAGARIKHGSGNLYIGNSDNSNWIGVQDICSQSSIGDGNWSLRTSGAAHFKDTTINGTATIKNLLSLVDGSHKGLKMGSTYISSLDGEVILQGNTALRFGNDAWDYNQWAGLKYDHSIKTVYLGIADGSIFKANSAQSGGVINLKQGISSVYTPALYAGGDIYHTGVYRMLWKNSKASKYLNVMNISQDDNGILTIGYGNFSNNKNVAIEGYNLNFRVGNDSGTKSMWFNYNNGNPVLSLDGNFYATGGVTAYKSSDERLKHDIHGVDSLAIIKAMGGTVAFRYNADNKDSIGWIAQRVLHNTFMQDLVEKDDKGFLKINYWSPKLIAVAFGAIEQVDDEVSRLKRRVRDLENEVEQLKSDRL